MKSIRRRIIGSLSTAVLLVCAVTFAIVYAAVRHQMLRQFDDAIEVKLHGVAGAAQFDDGRLQVDSDDDSLEDFSGKRPKSFFAIYDLKGVMQARSDSTDDSRFSFNPDEVGQKFHRFHRLSDGKPSRLMAMTVALEDERAEARLNPASRPAAQIAWIVVATDAQGLTEALNRLVASFAAAFTLIVAAFFLLGPSLVRRGLKPLDGFSSRAAALDVDTLSMRFHSSDLPSELFPIALSLDASLDRIAQAFERERLFAANAAHELRTPLAAIRANAEVALKWPESALATQSMQNVLRSVDRMSELVGRLLELARAGNQSAVLKLEDVDVSAILRAAIDANSITATSRKLTLRCSFDDGARIVKSNAPILQQLIDNVVTNAVRHALEGSEINITGEFTDRLVLTITNATNDLTADDLTEMFDPLWAKSPDRTDGSAGLGLALVKQYARLLDIDLNPSIDASARFHLVLRMPIF